jgi:hypothetical protein
MPKLTTAARRVSRVTRWTLAVAGVVVVAACGSPSTTAPPSAAAAAAAARPAPASARVKHADLLNGISCTGPAACVAVGSYYYGTAKQQTLVERRDGSSWRVERSPSRQRYSTLQSVSCPSATFCVAVGSLITGWNGARWTVLRRSSPFDSVSCSAAAFCIAVGVTAADTPEYGRWNGVRWQLRRMPGPPHRAQAVALAGVSCTGPGFCLAVGDYSYGARARPAPGFRDRALAEQWNGTRWRVIAPIEVTGRSELSAVSCPTPRACTAVGATASGQFALAERWDGSAWKVEHVPGPSRTGYTKLTAVSCSSASSCMAVGSYDGGASGIAEAWQAGAWRLYRLLSPPQPEPFAPPAGVSCASPAACTEVGTDGGTLAEVWDGTRWRITPTPDPR